jgi:hypothetical protein
VQAQTHAAAEVELAEAGAFVLELEAEHVAVERHRARHLPHVNHEHVEVLEHLLLLC